MKAEENSLYLFAIVALVVIITVMFFSSKKDIFTSSLTNIKDSGNTNIVVESQKTNQYDMYSSIATATGDVINGIFGIISNRKK